MAADAPAADLARERGIDLSLLRSRLRLTPTERVEKNLQALALVEALRTSIPRDAKDRAAS